MKVTGIRKEIISKSELMSLNQTVRIRTSDLFMGISEFKKGYQLRTKLVKDERGDLLVDPHKILNRWKNYFCQLLIVHGCVHLCACVC
jgi:hypothetical protein